VLLVATFVAPFAGVTETIVGGDCARPTTVAASEMIVAKVRQRTDFQNCHQKSTSPNISCIRTSDSLTAQDNLTSVLDESFHHRQYISKRRDESSQRA
jgi:hypothetical protein